MRGKAISATPSIKGINQLPNPPIEIGITIKKIITKAWAVTITLYKCSSPKNGPIIPNSKRISNLILRPTSPAHIPKTKYKVPISLWLVEVNHRSKVVKERPNILRKTNTSILKSQTLNFI